MPNRIFFVIMTMIISCTFSSCSAKKDKVNHSHIIRDVSAIDSNADSFWSFVLPESVGMDPEKLEGALTAIDKAGYPVHSMTIVKNGKIVMDCYGTDWKYDRKIKPDDLHELHSVTKSVTSILLGIAIDEGKIPGVTSKVMDWFAGDQIENLNQAKMDMTIEDLLTMRSGLQWNEGPDDSLFFDPPNAAVAILGRPMVSKPGTAWVYSSGNSQILGEIIRRSTGKTEEQYAVEKLFSPLGITKFKWIADKSGTSNGGWGLFLRPRDMAKIGYLCLKEGKWNDQQIIPAASLHEATIKHSATPWNNGGYGYHWWIPFPGGFAAQGYEGQMIYIFPEKDLVVVFTAKLDNNQATAILDGLMKDYILPSL